MSKAVVNSKYKQLLSQIGTLLEEGRRQSFKAVDNIFVKTYWNIGLRIIEHEQKGLALAEYEKALIKRLAMRLKCITGVSPV